MCKGSSTTTTSSSPNPQALSAYSSLLSQAGNVAATPYQQYGGELVAPINSQQQTGIAGINANANYAQPFINQAAGYATQAAAPITGQQIQQYESPFTQQVVNATEAQFNQQNQQQQSQLTGNAAAQGALGGDRVGVAQGTLAGQQQMAEAPVIAGLENQGYSTALQTALTEQQNLGNAAYSLGNLGISGQNAALSGATAQFGAGSAQQQTQQALDTAQYQQFLNQQAYPFQTTQWLAGIDTGVGSQMGGTSSTTAPPPNPFSSIAGLGLAALSLSDRRAKKNVQRIGETDDGQALYRYQYHGSNEWHIGPMAQEVEGRHPDAVHNVAGFGDLKFLDLKSATDDAAEPRKGLDTGGGIQFGGSPYSGGNGYVPTISITGGKGAPAPPGQPQTQQQNPLQMLKDVSTIKNAFGGKGGGLFGGSSSGSSTFGGFDYGDPDTAAAAQAGVDSGLTFDALTGDVFNRGGSVRPRRPMVAGFGTGGFVRPHFDDGGALMPIMLPPDSFEDRFGAAYGNPLVGAADDIPAAPSPGIVPDGYPSHAPGEFWPNSYPLSGIDPADRAMNNFGYDFNPVRTDANRTYGPEQSDYNLPAFATTPATPLPEPVEVADAHGPDVMAYSDERPSSPVAGLGTSGAGSSEGSRGFGFNPFGLSDNARTALLAAGLGMMASRSPFLANAVGEGGLQGLSTYSGLQKQEEEKKKSEASIEQGRQQLEQAAKQAQQRIDLETKKLALDEKKLEIGHFTPVPAMGIDPATGHQVTGTRVFDTKTGQSTFQPWVQVGKGNTTGSLPAEAWSTHGDEFLKYLPPEKQGVVKGIADYSIDPKSMSVTGGHREEYMNLAKQYDPNFDQKTYNTRFNAVNRFATGQQGNTVRSLNVAIDHLDTLDKLGEALNNNNVQAVNGALNYLQRQFGDSRITNFSAAKSIVADEVLKAVIGSGAGTQQDREDLQRQFSAANSPAQLKGVIGTAQLLMAGQMRGLEQQYKGATGLGDFQDRYLSQHTRERLAGASGAGASDPLAQARAAIARGAPRDAVIRRLQEHGIDTTGL